LTGYFSLVSGEQVFLSLAPLNFLLEKFFDAHTLFTMPIDLQMILLTAMAVPIWVLWLVGVALVYLILNFN
jgi:hypothetical protein